jgi:hypothetical protein
MYHWVGFRVHEVANGNGRGDGCNCVIIVVCSDSLENIEINYIRTRLVHRKIRINILRPSFQTTNQIHDLSPTGLFP